MATKSDIVAAAVAEVHAGASLRRTAAKFDIPRSTLHDQITGKRKQVGKGGPTVLTHDEEREIALTCMVLADMGFGLTKPLLEVVVFEYLKENCINNPFRDGVPGKDWWQRFLKRWPCLSQRKPQHLSKKRAGASRQRASCLAFGSVSGRSGGPPVAFLVPACPCDSNCPSLYPVSH